MRNPSPPLRLNSESVTSRLVGARRNNSCLPAERQSATAVVRHWRRVPPAALAGCGKPKNRFGISSATETFCWPRAVFLARKKQRREHLERQFEFDVVVGGNRHRHILDPRTQIAPGENHPAAFQRRFNQVHRQRHLRVSQIQLFNFRFNASGQFSESAASETRIGFSTAAGAGAAGFGDAKRPVRSGRVKAGGLVRAVAV